MARPFHELTEHGRARRLRPLAESALGRYDLTVRRLRLLSNSWNCVFRVDSDRGTFALRITLPAGHPPARVAAEARFLGAIAAGSDIAAPAPIPNREGELVTIASANGVPEPRACVLFEWASGRDLAETTEPAAWELLGSLSARLHAFAESWQPPAGFDTVVYDRAIHYGEPVRLFDDGVDLGPHRGLLAEALDAVDRRIAALDAPRIVTHGDLHQWNVKRHRQTLIPIDFEDLVWAAPILDVATSLYYVRRRPDYPELAAAFRRGYERHRPWVETEPGEIDRLLVARGIDLLNLVVAEPELDVPDLDVMTERVADLARITVGATHAVAIG